MSTPQTHSYCQYCGSGPLTWIGARNDVAECLACDKENYRNAVTVPIVLLPVAHEGRFGLIVIRRGKVGDPGYNELAFPGGFQGLEDWRDAATREVFEELGLIFAPSRLIELRTVSVPDGRINLKFCLAPKMSMTHAVDVIPAHSSSDEVAAWTFIWEPTNLAFPAHTTMCKDFFSSYPDVEGLR